MTIKIGIAGCRRGGALADVLKSTGFELVAAADPSESQRWSFCRRTGLAPSRCFDTYAGLLDAEVEAVIVASPMPNHVPQAVMALERGIHVLSEVPAAISLDQAQRLRDAARSSKAAYMMGENVVYMRPFQVVQAMARAGVFGELYYAEGQYLHDMRHLATTEHGGPTWRKAWLMDRRGATYSVHSLGPPLSWMQDRAVSVSARGAGSWVDPAFAGDDTAVMLAQTARGALISVRTDLRSRRPKTPAYFQLQGANGCYEGPRTDTEEHKVYLADRHRGVAWRPLRRFEREFLPERWRVHRRAASKAHHGGGDYIEMLAFAGACHGAPPEIDVYTALDWTLPGLMSEVSIERGGAPAAVPDPRTDELDSAAEAERQSGRFRDFVETV